eukprot:Hpha_TRINITY_DN2770_c0_g1::TRINITY_DN2770_c0_g1_i1::g.110485::m.110485
MSRGGTRMAAGSHMSRGPQRLLVITGLLAAAFFLSRGGVSQHRGGECKTLQQLKAGELRGATVLDLGGCDLTELPSETRSLSPSLRRLNLANNRLDSLPDWITELNLLQILFLLRNRFTEVPEVCARMPALRMLSLRGNEVARVPGNALNRGLAWLILTDNHIDTLPPEIGELGSLRKLMLSGNRLTELPTEILQCKSLELVRLASNRLRGLPDGFLELPKLAWIALSDNPFTRREVVAQPVTEALWADITVGKLLGEGTSGRVYLSTYKGDKFAAKEYKGVLSSDGTAGHEILATMQAQSHPHIIPALARIPPGEGRGQGILLGLVDRDRYKGAGLPPSFDSITRDTFRPGTRWEIHSIARAAAGLAAAMAHLHSRGLAHGDLYLHNTLSDQAGESLLGDFGAAFAYKDITELQGMERVEVRAFGCLVDDLLSVAAAGGGGES